MYVLYMDNRYSKKVSRMFSYRYSGVVATCVLFLKCAFASRLTSHRLQSLAFSSTLPECCERTIKTKHSFSKRKFSTIDASKPQKELNSQPAVSILITRMGNNGIPLYLIIQRGKFPGRYNWSFPGGRIKLGETSLAAAARELFEETNLQYPYVRYFPKPITGSDSIAYDSSGSVQFHFVLTQIYGWATPDAVILPGDDAMACKWATEQEICDLVNENQTIGRLKDVISWSESLRKGGILNIKNSISIKL